MPKGLQFVRGKIKSVVLADFKAVADASTGTVRISGFANTPVKDRYQEVVEVVAFASSLERFMKNPVMLWSHNMRDPIGLWDDVSLKPDGLYVSGLIHTQFPSGKLVADMAEAGLVRGLSIGFIELAGEWDEEDTYHITDLDLLEVSVVSIPANQEALFRVDGGKCTDIFVLPEEATAEQVERLGAELSPPRVPAESETLHERLTAFRADVEARLSTLDAAVVDLTQRLLDALQDAEAKQAAQEQALANIVATTKQELHDELAPQLAAIQDVEDILATLMDYVQELDTRTLAAPVAE